MENQPRCLNDQKTKKLIDAIEATDDKKDILEIKEYAYDEGENGKKHAKITKRILVKLVGRYSKIYQHYVGIRNDNIPAAHLHVIVINVIKHLQGISLYGTISSDVGELIN